jgi:hypothetical protein
MTENEELKASYDVLKEQGGIDSKTELYIANPKLVRELNYHFTASPDVLNPKSEDLERAYNLEAYDRMILNPIANQEEAYRLLLSSYDTTKRNPDKFIMKPEQNPMTMNPMLMGGAGGQEQQGQQNNNLNIKTANALPQTAGNLKV